MEIESRLNQLGLTLPDPPKPVGAYLTRAAGGRPFVPLGHHLLHPRRPAVQRPPGHGSDRQ